MDQDYTWQFSDPEHRLMVHMENREDGQKIFDATLRMHREEISGSTLARALLRYPWLTARVALGIYWQALRLRMKKTPYYDHPEASAA